MVSPPRSTKHAQTSSPREMMERAARIAAMLDRWDAEDVSGEPEWNNEDFGALVDALAWSAVQLAET